VRTHAEARSLPDRSTRGTAKWIVRLALRRPYTFVVGALVLLLVMPFVLQRTPTDILPSIDIPVVSVIWLYNGLSAKEMEERIAYNHERVISAQVGDIEHIESSSYSGAAVIKVFFQPGASVDSGVFQGGQLDANLRVSKSGFEESVARYRQTVLAAFAEVETSLAAQRLLASERESESAALEAARKQLEIANDRYKAGLVTFLNVAVAQTVALAHERAAIRLQGGQCAAAVAIVKSPGGGWTQE
jgi:hypothetical protein